MVRLAHRLFGVVQGLLRLLAGGVRLVGSEFRPTLRFRRHPLAVVRGPLTLLDPLLRLARRRIPLAGQAGDLGPKIGLLGVLKGVTSRKGKNRTLSAKVSG